MDDEPCPIRLVEVTSDTTNEALLQLVVKDRQMKLLEMARALDISNGSVHAILYDCLGIRKLLS